MHIKLKLKQTYTLEKIEKGRLMLKIGSSHFCLNVFSEETAMCFLKLIHGISENQLVKIIHKNEIEKETLLSFLRSLHNNCCFDYCFYQHASQKAPIFVISPKTTSTNVLEETKKDSIQPISTDCTISKFTYLRWVNSLQLLENPLASLSIAISDSSLINSCLSLAKFNRAKPNRCLKYLRHVLLRENFIQPQAQTEKLCIKMWSFHDLLFHKNSRMQEFPYPPNFGASFPFKEIGENLPLVKAPMSDIKIELEKPNLDNLAAKDPSLTAVLEKRQTRRQHSQNPISKQQLGELLYRVFHVKHQEEVSGQKIAFHVYPNAGGQHEFEIYILINNCKDLVKGIYQYNFTSNSLFLLSNVDDLHLNEMLKLAAYAWANKSHQPQILIILSPKFPRIFWKYEGIGYRNSLVNAGAIVQTLYLVGEAMNLAVSCLGYGCSDLFSKIIQADPLEETSILELAIGNK